MAFDHTYYPPVSTLKVGFSACCPRCGEGKLYDGLPVIFGLSIYTMRVIKAMLIARQYTNNASQGELYE